MNPTSDLKGEHDAIEIVLSAMSKLASDILENKPFDLFRIAQILDFLITYTHKCHHDKEELVLFPAMVECDAPWIADTIHLLNDEHIIARNYLKAIDSDLRNYLAGHVYALESLGLSLLSYIAVEENHIKIENQALLPLADKFLNKTKLDSIYLDFKQIQNQKITKNQHLEYYILLRKLYFETRTDHVMAHVY